MKATTKITCKEIRELWEKAVTYSRLEKEYASQWLKVEKPWWKVWEKTGDMIKVWRKLRKNLVG